MWPNSLPHRNQRGVSVLRQTDQAVEADHKSTQQCFPKLRPIPRNAKAFEARQIALRQMAIRGLHWSIQQRLAQDGLPNRSTSMPIFRNSDQDVWRHPTKGCLENVHVRWQRAIVRAAAWGCEVLIPNADNAVLDIRKLRDYCLDTHHDLGGHKARVFRSVLSIDRSDADWLREEILRAIANADARQTKQNAYGDHYAAKITVTRQNRTAVINTTWIIRHNEDFPRFTSAWVI
jgi:hypothetical protein